MAAFLELGPLVGAGDGPVRGMSWLLAGVGGGLIEADERRGRCGCGLGGVRGARRTHKELREPLLQPASGPDAVAVVGGLVHER